jgi:hypothetical protein
MSIARPLCRATVPPPHSSVDSNGMQLSPPALRSHHNSPSERPEGQEYGYVSSVDGCDEDAVDDDDLEDNKLVA